MIRREILGTGDDAGAHAIGLVDLTARYALSRGFDVIVEGLLSAPKYQETLLRLAVEHQGVTRCYIYDVSFEETVRRHLTKPVADAFDEVEMRQWWRGFQPVDGLDEAVIDQHESLESTMARVLSDCWPVP